MSLAVYDFPSRVFSTVQNKKYYYQELSFFSKIEQKKRRTFHLNWNSTHMDCTLDIIVHTYVALYCAKLWEIGGNQHTLKKVAAVSARSQQQKETLQLKSQLSVISPGVWHLLPSIFRQG